jgi:hypothetical protein
VPASATTNTCSAACAPCYQFATDTNCHGQILAHPAKMEGARRGQGPDPGGYRRRQTLGQRGRPGLHGAPAEALREGVDQDRNRLLPPKSEI